MFPFNRDFNARAAMGWRQTSCSLLSSRDSSLPCVLTLFILLYSSLLLRYVGEASTAAIMLSLSRSLSLKMKG